MTFKAATTAAVACSLACCCDSERPRGALGVVSEVRITRGAVQDTTIAPGFDMGTGGLGAVAGGLVAGPVGAVAGGLLAGGTQVSSPAGPPLDRVVACALVVTTIDTSQRYLFVYDPHGFPRGLATCLSHQVGDEVALLDYGRGYVYMHSPGSTIGAR